MAGATLAQVKTEAWKHTPESTVHAVTGSRVTEGKEPSGFRKGVRCRKEGEHGAQRAEQFKPRWGE